MPQQHEQDAEKKAAKTGKVEPKPNKPKDAAKKEGFAAQEAALKPTDAATEKKGAPGSATMIDVSDDKAFEQVTSQKGIVLAFFTVAWSGPCKVMAPTLKALQAAYAGAIQVARVDIDNAPTCAEKQGVSSVPTVLVFKDGSLVDQLVGVKGEAALKARIDAQL